MKAVELFNFLKSAYEKLIKGYKGCIYTKVADKLYLVTANTNHMSADEETLVPTAKLAYNCDDLQCDYDVDWFMPVYTDGYVYDAEFEIQLANLDDQIKTVIADISAIEADVEAGILSVGD